MRIAALVWVGSGVLTMGSMDSPGWVSLRAVNSHIASDGLVLWFRVGCLRRGTGPSLADWALLLSVGWRVEEMHFQVPIPTPDPTFVLRAAMNGLGFLVRRLVTFGCRDLLVA